VEGEHLAVEILPDGDLVAALGVRYGEGVCDLDLFRFCLLTGGGRIIIMTESKIRWRMIWNPGI